MPELVKGEGEEPQYLSIVSHTFGGLEQVPSFWQARL